MDCRPDSRSGEKAKEVPKEPHLGKPFSQALEATSPTNRAPSAPPAQARKGSMGKKQLQEAG